MQFSSAVYFDHILVGGVVHSSTTGEWMAFTGVGVTATWVGNYKRKADAVRRVRQFARGRR
jgi:hypothetical protein